MTSAVDVSIHAVSPVSISDPTSNHPRTTHVGRLRKDGQRFASGRAVEHGAAIVFEGVVNGDHSVGADFHG